MLCDGLAPRPDCDLDFRPGMFGNIFRISSNPRSLYYKKVCCRLSVAMLGSLLSLQHHAVLKF